MVKKTKTALSKVLSKKVLDRDGVNPARRYEVSGAGTPQVNGVYFLQGDFINDKPYWKMGDVAAIWYHKSKVIGLDSWNGWYISQKVDLSLLGSFSASADYYSAYVHGPLPPSKGWVTRPPGLSLAAGAGSDPPPVYVGPLPEDDESDSDEEPGLPSLKRLPTLMIGKSESNSAKLVSRKGRFPAAYELYGAGLEGCNGLFEFSGIENERPYYIKKDGGQALWFFNFMLYGFAEEAGSASTDKSSTITSSSLFSVSKAPIDSSSKKKSKAGLLDYNGWYISKEVNNNFLSASGDFYSSYCDADLPPENYDDWVTRKIGSLDGGSGVPPHPHIKIHEDSGYLLNIRVSAPDGNIVHVVRSERMSVSDFKSSIQKELKLPAFAMRLVLRDDEMIDGKLVDFTITSDDVIVVTEIREDELIAREKKIDRKLAASARPGVRGDDLKVCVVGGGPVGLWTAAQLKIMNPDWTVVCFEKQKEYKRHHALRLEKKAFEFMVKDDRLEALVKKWRPRTRTSVIEEDLVDLLKSIGVEVVFEKLVSDIEGIIKENNFELLIGCDGARSKVRQYICGKEEKKEEKTDNAEEFKVKREIGFLLQIKFEAEGKVEKAGGDFEKFLQNLPASQTFFNILPGNYDEETKTTPCTCFALINEEVFELFKDIPSFSGTSLESLESKEDPRLDALVGDVAGVMKTACPNGIKEGSMKVSTLPVIYSVAKKVVKIAEIDARNVPVVIAGDAAMGLSLEKGLNYGWFASNVLCKFLSFSRRSSHDSVAETIEKDLKGYEIWFDNLSDAAIAHVERDYKNYVSVVKTASFARTLVSTLSLGLASTSTFVGSAVSSTRMIKSKKAV